MTPEQKALVQASYQRLMPLADTAAQLFYSKLFEIDPSLRTLFKVDFHDQVPKFVDMMHMLVTELNHADRVDNILRELGARHVGYGVIDAYYETVRQALLWAIEKALGRNAGPELKEAWSEFYNLVASRMKEGAHARHDAR